MSKSSNVIGFRARYELKSLGKTIEKSTQELISGRTSVIDNVVSYLIGTRNSDSAKVLTSVAESAKYGTNLLDVGISELISQKDTLTQLRTTIVQAGIADSTALTNLNNFYQSQVGAAITKLANANFNGRSLFDGSLAGGVPTVGQGIPAGAGPLNIRMGEAINNNLPISFNKLLSGIANAADASVPGRFTPLFPTTGGAGRASTDASVVATAVVTSDEVEEDPTVVAVETATENPATNNYQNLSNIFFRDPAALQTLTGTIVAAALTAAAGNKNALGGDAAITAAITNNITAILSNAAAGIPSTGAAVSAAEVTTIIGASVNSFLSAGILFTAASRASADTVISNAVKTLDSAIASLSGQSSILNKSIADVNKQVSVYETAANDFLVTDPANAADEFAKSLYGSKVAYYLLSKKVQIDELVATLIKF